MAGTVLLAGCRAKVYLRTRGPSDPASRRLPPGRRRVARSVRFCSWACSGGNAGAGAGRALHSRNPKPAANGHRNHARGGHRLRHGAALTFVNPAFERLTGYPAEDLREQEFLQYIHHEDRPAILAEWDRLAQGNALRDQEYRVITRSGQIRWCSSSWEPMRDESGRQIGLLGTEFDITERKLAEEAMRLDTELFQAVLEVEKAVSAAGLDSDTVMRVIAERSRGLTGASGAVIEAIEGEDVVPLVHVGTDGPRLKLSASLSGSRVAHRRAPALRRHSLRPPGPAPGLPGAGHPLHPGRAPERRAPDPRRAQGGLTRAPRVHRPGCQGAPAAGWSHGRRPGPCRGVRRPDRHGWKNAPERCRKASSGSSSWSTWRRKASGWPTTAGVMTYVNQRLADLLGYGNGTLLGRPVYRLHRGRFPGRAPSVPWAAACSAGTEPGPALPAAGRHPALGPGLVQPDPGQGRRPGRNRRHGHRYHRAKTDRGAAPPLGRPAHHAARHGPGNPRGAVARRR